MQIKIRENRTLKGRIRRAALYWGLPIAALEVISLPFQPAVLLLAVPVFIVATATAFATETAVVKIGAKLTSPPK